MQWKKCMGIFALIGTIACVSPLQALAASSSEIEEQIASYMEDLEASQEKSEELQDEISARQEEVGALYADVASLNIEKESYLEEMKTRIAYFYEEMRPQTLLSALFGANSFAELINRIQFQQSVYEYDAARMEEYEDLVDELEEKEDRLDTEIEDLGDMVEEQAVLQATLDATISDKNEELEEAKAEEAAAAATKAAAEAAAKEAARRAEEDALAYALSATDTAAASSSEETASVTEEATSQETASESQSVETPAVETQAEEPAVEAPAETTTESQDTSSSSSSSGYNMPSGSGVLTRSGGVNYYNGHRETWYSQRVLPGGGLNIPGRHVDSRGIICDGDGYICVASSDYAKGTVVETSLDTAKVYDCGCASGTIDIYTDW